ncbi:LytR C-terminal domain-containing protein [Thiohalorhabdus sp. Cl-TMA]|uniref:LytR C-terminal domain-containing protein n=1 Tax=Thiohalorhabdus methylotrophus TaxID=3242694 RepID=A0ABV4U0V8_9GAMM
MRATHFRALLAGGLAFCTAAGAAESTSGLRLRPISLPDTHTMPAGATELSAQLGLSRYSDSDSSRDVTDLDLAPELAYGITDRLEFGLSSPYRYRVDDGDSGRWRHLGGRVTYRFLERPDTGRYSAFTLRGSTLNDSGDPPVSSGENTYSAEWHLSERSAVNAVSIALGYAKRDYPKVRKEPAYKSAVEYYAQWAYGHVLSPELAFTGELTYNYARADRLGSLEVMPGLRYTKPEAGVSVAMGLGYCPGLDGARPDARALLSLTYRPPGPAGLSQRMGRLEGQVETLRTEVRNLRQTLAEQPAKEETSEPRQASPAISLSLVNASGEAGLARTLGERLGKQGYEVVNVIAEDRPVQSVTHLYYREGFKKPAVTLGRALPGNQTLTHYTHLPADVDIQVLVGTDQVD